MMFLRPFRNSLYVTKAKSITKTSQSPQSSEHKFKHSFIDKHIRPGSFAETITVTVSFPQNVNGGNDNSFLQHFP